MRAAAARADGSLRASVGECSSSSSSSSRCSRNGSISLQSATSADARHCQLTKRSPGRRRPLVAAYRRSSPCVRHATRFSRQDNAIGRVRLSAYFVFRLSNHLTFDLVVLHVCGSSPKLVAD